MNYIEVTRPGGITYPLDVKVAWVTPGPGREALNRVLAGVFVLEVDHLAQAVAARLAVASLSPGSANTSRDYTQQPLNPRHSQQIYPR